MKENGSTLGSRRGGGLDGSGACGGSLGRFRVGVGATMTLSMKQGRMVGVWASQGREMEMTNLAVEGDRLTFKRSIGGGTELAFEGVIRKDKIAGAYPGPFGELPSHGQRVEWP